MREIQRLLRPDPAFDGEVGLWVATLDEVRRQTRDLVQGLDPKTLAAKPPGGGNSIGQLLRHIAIVELDWVLNDLARGQPLPPDAPEMARMEDPMADPGPRALDEFLSLLDWARGVTRRTLAAVNAPELESLRVFQGPDGVKKTFTVRWILFHIAEHEAHHKGQIAAVKRMVKSGP